MSFVERAMGYGFLDLEQQLEVPQRVFSDLASMVVPEIVEPSSRVGDASNFSDTALEGEPTQRPSLASRRARIAKSLHIR